MLLEPNITTIGDVHRLVPCPEERVYYYKDKYEERLDIIFPTTVPARPPPSGLTSNFTNPQDRGNQFAAVAITFLSLAVFIVSLRVYTQFTLLKRIDIDDYVMVLAILLSIATSGLMLDLLNYGLGKHIWDVPLTLFSPEFLKISFVAETLFCMATAASKISILLFYLRIFPGWTFRLVTWAVILVAIAYGLGTALANLFGCWPIYKAWDLDISNSSCIHRLALYYANAGLGIFVDSATLLLPIPKLKKLQLPLRQKIGLGAMLMGGGL
ncbi:hypothetical protein MMC29_002701 [Sticta canariensis]|nr:hypothetical protein [Sticta canariensis]